MPLGGPPVYPSCNPWLGVKREIFVKCSTCQSEATWHILYGCLDKHIVHVKRCGRCKMRFANHLQAKRLKCYHPGCRLMIDQILIRPMEAGDATATM